MNEKLMKYRKVRNLLEGDRIYITHPRTGKVYKAAISGLKKEYPPTMELFPKGEKRFKPGCMSFHAHIIEGHPEVESLTIHIYADPNDYIPQPF